MKHKKLIFIANSLAGQGRTLDLLHAIRRCLWGWECEFRVTGDPGKTAALCRGLDPDAYEAVFLIGGDGTVNSALAALMQCGLPLGIIPAGTANDLARKLGIAIDWELIQQLVDHRCTDYIDIAEVNGKPFATVGGIGVGAHIAREFNHRRAASPLFKRASRIFTTGLYSLLSAKTLMCDDSYVHDLRISGDGFSERLCTAAVFVANQSSLGGAITVAPSALINDTKLDVIVLRDTRKRAMLASLQAFRTGRTPPDSMRFVTSHLTIQDMDGRPVPAFGDGELLAEAPTLEFTVRPRALHVYRQDRLLDSVA